MSTDAFTNGDGCRQKEVTGLKVFLCLVAFFAVVVAVNGAMMYVAVSTFAGLDTENPYAAGLAFEQEIAAVRAQDALHWQVQGKVDRTDAGATTVEISARDAGGHPLVGLTASVALVHPADERLDHSLVMSEDAPGHFTGTSDQAAGQWDLVIELSRSGERMFRSRNRVVLH
jgi:nitrogen fixation protein FixH